MNWIARIAASSNGTGGCANSGQLNIATTIAASGNRRCRMPSPAEAAHAIIGWAFWGVG